MNLTKSELPKDLDLKKFIKTKAIIDGMCQRCGQTNIKDYCDNCKELSIIKVGDYLYKKSPFFVSPKNIAKNDILKLTNLQQKCSNYLLNIKRKCIVWAVCGAGKTEITFEVIYQNVKKGEIVCFAITRKDILYEIQERLMNYFSNVKIAVINSDEDKYVDADIYVMTTNQVLRYKDAFSLVIVDEVDAFPYEYNDKFDYAIKNSIKDDGKIIYLTSTPSEKLLNEREDRFIIYERWHKKPLPIPSVKHIQNKNKIPSNLVYNLMFKKRKQLIFLSNKKECENLCKYINTKLKIKCLATHSSHEKRRENIEIFRKSKEYNVLVTTTILERGVTFKDIDVYVIDAYNKLYTIAALVQISGRVGRYKEYQNGSIIFYTNEYTTQIKTCIKQIKKMNYLSQKYK